MANRLTKTQITLPATITAQTIKDENGQCWTLSGLQAFVEGQTEFEDDFTIQDSEACCGACDFKTLEILDLSEYFDDDEIVDLDDLIAYIGTL